MIEYHFDSDYDHFSDFAAAALSPLAGIAGGLMKDVTGALSDAKAKKTRA